MGVDYFLLFVGVWGCVMFVVVLMILFELSVCGFVFGEMINDIRGFGI